MARTHTLTTGRGKNKRTFELNDEEFSRFEMMFGENELVDISDFYDENGNLKITLTQVEI